LLLLAQWNVYICVRIHLYVPRAYRAAAPQAAALAPQKQLSALSLSPAFCRPALGTRAAAATARCIEERTAFILSSTRYDVQS
jgi:hypothetical protein